MSEFREDLLISPINKKRLIGIFLVTILLISLFAFSVLLYSLLFGTQRPFPSDLLSEAEYEEGNPVFIPIPFNWSDIFDNLNLSQDQLQDLLDSLQDMFDGDIDDLDLGNFSQSILGLLASEIEVFRVFYYNDINAMTNKLWKYECFDEYTGDGWHSTASTQNYNFYSYNDWLTYHSDKDLLKIKIPLTPTLGINSMVAPTLFPNPYVIDGSIFAPNMVLTPPDDPKLYKDDFNSTTMDLTFTSEADVNMSYYMFGLNLPSNDDINNSAVEAMYTPPVIQNRYLQLPLTLNAYLTNNYFVNQIFVTLNNTIKEYDNAFVVANKIRNYLQTYFTFPIDPNSYNPAPPGRDVVDWFCETKQGVWSDFASAFCVFCRIFGVASRFVDGFNSFGIQEMFDPFEGANGFAIKYKNLYNWAEIYVPSDFLGNGQWVQMDIIFDSFGTGGNPVTGGDYNISVYTDQPFPAVYYRPDIANITAYLTSITEPIDNIGITFRDVSSGELLGIDYTDIYGQASILVNINDSKVVGHHLIEARVNPVIANYTLFTIPGDIKVELTLVSPTMVNRSDTWPDITNVTGYVYDPVANKRVKDAEVNFKLLQYGTNNEIFNAFIPSTQFTDPNGEFSEILNVNPSVPAGQYEIRVDFNGTWMLPIFYVPFTSIVPITNSSQRWEFNITKALSLYFYINSFPANDPNNPLVYRDDPLILTARVMLENVGPVQGKRVFFHDWTRGRIELGSDISDVNGFASITIPANNSFTAGPNLLFARYRMQENFSYFILNEEPTIFAIGPYPREINRTGSGNSNTIFNIQGDITDSTNGNPLRNCELRLRLLRGGLDYSSYLIPSEYFWSRFDGSFDWNFEVASNTPIGNYTLRIDFNGTLDYSGHPIYPYFFNLPLSDLETSYLLPNELSVSSLATLSFNFWINGTTSYDYNQPIINYNDHLDLSVYLTWGGAPIGDGEPIDFYDVTQDFFIGTAFTNLGFAQILYSTDFFTIAGPHQIYARWGSYYNFSYFILDEQIVVDFESGPVPREISRGQTIFNLHGYVNDSFNRSPIKYAEISVHLYDLSETEVFGYLIHESGSLQLDDTGEFDLYYSVSGSTPDQNYTIKVEFNGIFLYSYPPSNNPYDFFLFLPNFYDIVNASHQLKVNDPDNLDIYLAVEGNPTLPFYDNSNPPETYGFGEVAHIQVTVVHIEDIFNREVRIYDDYDNTLLNSSIFTIHAFTGFIQFNIPTINFHAGLNRLRVEYHSFATINTTYVVVNETITITPSPTWYSVLRNFDSFYLNTYIQDGTIDLNGLEITILLLNSTFNDVSFYLNIAGPQTITVYNGYYQFNINSINLNCPEGQYYLIIEFYGNIFDAGVSLFNYMGYESSSLIPINVSAGTTLSGNYDTRVVKDQFYEGDDLYAYGYLRWDNGTGIADMLVNVTIRDSLGGIIASGFGTTESDGSFNITIVIGAGWPDNAEVWVSFYPEDNFPAPRYYFIKSSEQQLFRP
ncbi:MAG: transglutaminase-like domain-containing protein [Promethearchaeota archaeon]